MKRTPDLTGQRFGTLVVISREANAVGGAARWRCRCDCGNETVAQAGNLKHGFTKSCGCLWHAWKTRKTKHGMTGTPEYRVWQSMKQRCFKPTTKHYHRYGGRGITVCDEWKNDFNAFFQHIGPRPTPNHSVDRINNDGNYEPGNVRWATRSEQQNNKSPRAQTA